MRDVEWDEKCAALRAYVEERNAFPSSSKPGQKILAGWWTSQRRAQRTGDLSPKQCAELDEIAQHVQDARPAGRTDQAVNMAAAEQARRDKAVERARAALSCPYLTPAEEAVLQARVDNPRATITDLGELLGKSPGAVSASLNRAVRMAERLNAAPVPVAAKKVYTRVAVNESVAPGRGRPDRNQPVAYTRVRLRERLPPARPRRVEQVAEQLGVTVEEVDVLRERGTLPHTITKSGSIAYPTAGVRRVRRMLEETILAVAFQAAGRPKADNTPAADGAAERIGVTREDVVVLVSRGTVPATVDAMTGRHTYRNADLDAVRAMLHETVQVITDQATGR